MEVKLRKIGNAMGVIFPKEIMEQAKAHAGDRYSIFINNSDIQLHKYQEDLSNRIIAGIKASEKDDVEFSDSFFELGSEQW